MAGGAGSAVNEHLIKLNSSSKILNLGLPDEFIEQDNPKNMYDIAGLNSPQITKKVLDSVLFVPLLTGIVEDEKL